MLTQVKICGLCRPADAAMAAQAGADYVGVICVPGHARAQTRETARAIFSAGGAARRVGVFVDAPESVVLDTADHLGLDVVQLHGAETITFAERVRESGRTVWKAIRPRTTEEYLDAVGRWSEIVDGLLIDGWSANAAGGSGVRFDWYAIHELRDRVPAGTAFIAAGGLRPDNVAEAVRLLQPDVVDVSSGVETSLCEKSPARVQEFIEAVRSQAVLESFE